MPLSAKLVVVGGEVKSAEIKLRLPSTIGRGRGATIMLPHPLVSRQHCELFETNGRLMVRDLGSLNGTFVNNERISEAPLPPGELLTVGAVTFRAVYELPESTAPPEGPGPRLKSGASRDTDPSGTVRATPKSERETHRAVQSSEPTVPLDDFNFEMPVTPVDEGAQRPTDPAPRPPASKPEAAQEVTPVAEKPVAEKTSAEKTSAEKQGPSGQTQAGPSPAKPGASAPEKAGSAAPAPTSGNPPANEKLDFSKWAQEDDQQHPPGQDDDDFGDFLKSLGNK